MGAVSEWVGAVLDTYIVLRVSYSDGEAGTKSRLSANVVIGNGCSLSKSDG